MSYLPVATSISDARKEIKEIAKELRRLKDKMRTPEFNKMCRDFSYHSGQDPYKTILARTRLKRLYTKLVAYVAHRRGRKHFAENTNYSQVDWSFPMRDGSYDVAAWISRRK